MAGVPGDFTYTCAAASCTKLDAGLDDQGAGLSAGPLFFLYINVTKARGGAA